MITQKIQMTTIVIAIGGALVAFVLALNAPEGFPKGIRFEVNEGESLHSISERLENEHLVTSALIFRGWISLLGQDKDIKLGIYEFKNTLPLGLVVAKIVKGPDEPLLSVTIPEGYSTEEVASSFEKAMPAFSAETFVMLVHTEHLDGYLFPSTYYPLPSHTEQDIANLMKETFDREYAKYFAKENLPKSLQTRQQVVSLAALLEGEANTEKDMRIVSGILQKRLERGMRLQVDVATSTYGKDGVPEQPVGNPGIVAIRAVFQPSESPYLYYLTGRDGKMYYAKTFEEHKRNIDRYLR
jgi:UPF0755 protein